MFVLNASTARPKGASSGVPDGWGAPPKPVMTFMGHQNGTGGSPAKASSSASKSAPAVPSPPAPRMIPAVSSPPAPRMIPAVSSPPAPQTGPAATEPSERASAVARDARDAHESGMLKTRDAEYQVRVLRPLSVGGYFVVHVPELDGDERLAVRIVQQKDDTGVFSLLPSIAAAVQLAKDLGATKVFWKKELNKFRAGPTTLADIASGKIMIYVGEDIAAKKVENSERRSGAKKHKGAEETEEVGDPKAHKNDKDSEAKKTEAKKTETKKTETKKRKTLDPKQALKSRLDEIDRQRRFRRAKDTSAARLVHKKGKKDEDLFGDSGDESAGEHDDNEGGDYAAMRDSESEAEVDRNAEADEVSSIDEEEEAMMVEAMQSAEAMRSNSTQPAAAESSRKRKLQAQADRAGLKRLRKAKRGGGFILSQAEDSEDSDGSEGSDDSAASMASFINDGSVEEEGEEEEGEEADEEREAPVPAFSGVQAMPLLPSLDSMQAMVAQEPVAGAPRQVTASAILRSLAGLIGLCADYFDHK